MKEVLALQNLESQEVEPQGWTTITWTVTGFLSTISNNC
ncbi:class III lanthipeptide [Aeribacillus sp. FSL K6-8394]